MNPHIQYLVTRQDESQAKGFGSPYIPTIGHAANTFDAYRIAALHSIENKPASWSMTDTDAAAALGRIVDGPIQSHKDIEYAESALRAILLHDYVEVLVPCVKAEQNTGLVHYVRLDKQERNAAAFAALQVAPCFDRLLALEYVNIANGQVTASSNSSSILVDTSVDDIGLHYRGLLKNASELAFALPAQIGAATYYTGEEWSAPINGGAAGFIDGMYRRVYRQWIDIAQDTPSLYVDVRLPPLLSIVLSRSPTREKIPDVLNELREELLKARTELNRLNSMLDKCMSQADIHAQTRRVNESFDAIVPEALLTDAERRWRRIASVYRFISPVRQLYSAAIDPLAVNYEKLQEFFSSAHAAVAADSRIVSRSVASATMAELLRMGSVRETIMTHFSTEEVRLISGLR